MQRKYRLIREEAYRQGDSEFAELAASTPDFRDFVCLYIGESGCRRELRPRRGRIRSGVDPAARGE